MKIPLSEYDININGVIISYNYDNIVKIDSIINEYQPNTIKELKELLDKITILKYKIVKIDGYPTFSGVNVIIYSNGCNYSTDAKQKQYKLPLAYGNSYIIKKEN